MLRLRSSRKMYGVSLFPPSFDICSAVVHHLADYAGAHVDAGAGASTAHVEGLSTAGSLPSSVEGLMRALLVRGTPLTPNVVNLVRELTYRTLFWVSFPVLGGGGAWLAVVGFVGIVVFRPFRRPEKIWALKKERISQSLLLSLLLSLLFFRT